MLRNIREEIRAILRAHLTPSGIGWAVAVGIVVGALPIYGIHLGVCVLLARWLRLNQAVVYGAANISNPLFAPFLITAEIAVGEWLRFGSVPAFDLERYTHQSFWSMLTTSGDMLWSCTLGSVVLGVGMAPVFGLTAYAIARYRQRHDGPPDPAP